MAIQAEKLLPNGYTGDYWRISSEVYDKKKMTGEWTLTLYKSYEHYQSGGDHLNVHKRFFAPMTKEEMQGDRTQIAYTKIMEIANEQVPYLTGDGTYLRDPDIAAGVQV